MSEFDGRPPEDAVPNAAEPVVSAGTLLRRAREASGLHIAALAVSLKVPVKKLEALEGDRFDVLPDAVFVRALAASVCRTLKIDATEVLALLPQTGKPRLGYQNTAINTPFRAPNSVTGPTLWTQISRPAVLAGLLLVLGALVLVLLPAVQQQGTAAQPATGETEAFVAMATPDTAQGSQASPSAVVMASVNSLDKAPATVSDIPVAPVAPAVPVAAALPTPPPPVSASPAVTVPAAANASPTVPALAAPQPATTAGIIVFKAKGESWVEVTDAKGVVVLRRTLAAGEAAAASGALPLAAVVGRVDMTQVQIRGQAFDLNAVSKDNVARFEVK